MGDLLAARPTTRTMDDATDPFVNASPFRHPTPPTHRDETPMTQSPTSDLAATIMEFADGEFKALVTIETVERLAVHAIRALGEGDDAAVLRLLSAITDTTTARTCTAVKDQYISDAISLKAREAVTRTLGGL